MPLFMVTPGRLGAYDLGFGAVIKIRLGIFFVRGALGVRCESGAPGDLLVRGALGVRCVGWCASGPFSARCAKEAVRSALGGIPRETFWFGSEPDLGWI